eukprot:scaffold5054_cov42-Phaeocystis_antarctica.AAC.2
MVPEGSKRARGGGGAAKEKGKTSHRTARITALGVRSKGQSGRPGVALCRQQRFKSKKLCRLFYFIAENSRD